MHELRASSARRVYEGWNDESHWLPFEVRKEDWRDDARCAGESSERGSYAMFFDYEQGGTPAGRRRLIQRTKYEFCASCPVAYECFRFAVDNSEWDGVYGGMEAEERDVFIRKHKTPRVQQVAHEKYINELKDRAIYA